MAAPVQNIDPKPKLPSIRDLLSSPPMVPMEQETSGKDVSLFVVPSEQNLPTQYFHISDREDEDEERMLRRKWRFERRFERNRLSAMALRSLRKEREVEDVKTQPNYLPWGSTYAKYGDFGGLPTYQKAYESQNAAWKMIKDSAAGVAQAPEFPWRMSHMVDRVDVALEKLRRRDREAQRACRERVKAYIQELEQKVEKAEAISRTLPVSSFSEEDVFDVNRYMKSLLMRRPLTNGADATEGHGFPRTEDCDIEQLSMENKTQRVFTRGLPLLREKYRYPPSNESSASQLRNSLLNEAETEAESFRRERGDHGLGNDDGASIESMVDAANAVFFSGGLSERVRWAWSAQEPEYLTTIGYGTAPMVHSCDETTSGLRNSSGEVHSLITKRIGTKLQFKKPIYLSEQDRLWETKYDRETSYQNYLQGYHSASEEGIYSGFSWSRLRRILDGNEKLATAMIFLARLTGAVASSTEPQPASPESLLETTVLAACLGAVFTAVVYLERCKEVLTPLMIVMPFACLDLGREIAFPERQLLLVAIFSASLNIAWLKSKLAKLPRTGGLTALLIAAIGFLSACGAAYYLPAMGGRYADRFILAAVSTLFMTMVWSVVWVVCFHNLGLAQRLEVGEYDEHIGAFTKRIFETWINQLITHVCESLISRIVGSNTLPSGLKQHAGDAESVSTGGSSRRESFWTVADTPRTPPRSWRGDMSPSPQ
ncbi:hypothetical protein IFR05_001840 [Cadophora sp. M221]|nr:hypothetical protein IFR05_001840 [Cadophora sp. M221]